MRIVNGHLAVSARLIDPAPDGFLILAAEVGSWRGPFPAGGPMREPLLRRLVDASRQLAEVDGVIEATAFRAALRPPGEGQELLHRRGVQPARYDLVVQVRTTQHATATALRGEPIYRGMVRDLREGSKRVYETVATNARRISDVDHRPDVPYLFNYFYADDTETLLDVWQYTAGWFQEKTDLRNSTLMQPVEGEPRDYGIINHASWPTYRAFLPHLALRPGFRRFVLANFKANRIAAQPIIYRRIAQAARTARRTRRALS